jgi:hypothetical protein
MIVTTRTLEDSMTEPTENPTSPEQPWYAQSGDSTTPPTDPGQPWYAQAGTPTTQPAPAYPPGWQQAYEQQMYDQQVYGTPPPGYAPAGPVQYVYVAPNAAPPGTMTQTAYGPFVVSHKTRLAAGLLGIFLGMFGVGQFYRGNVGLGIAQIAVSFTGIGFLWPFIEGIVTLCVQPGAPLTLDSDHQLMPMT